jgi:transcriptional regulator NrdR family protein
MKDNPKKVENDRGLQCRQCGRRHFRVVYTRAAWGGRIIRRRECRTCGERLTTWERAIGEYSGKLDN